MTLATQKTFSAKDWLYSILDFPKGKTGHIVDFPGGMISYIVDISPGEDWLYRRLSPRGRLAV